MTTEKQKFYKIYLPLLKKALMNENTLGLLDPECYANNDFDRNMIIDYTEYTEDDPFIDRIAYYYDAREHNFPDAGSNLPIDKAKDIIIEQMYEIAKYYSIDLD